MSPKGKEKEVESDSDDDLAYFTKKPVFAARPPPRPPSPTSDGSVHSDDSEATKKRKRRKKQVKRPPKPTAAVKGKVGRGSSETAGRSSASRERSSNKTKEVIEVGSEPGHKRPRVVLTPPPELGEAERARIKRIINQLHPEEGPVPVESDDEGDPSALRIRTPHSEKKGSFRPDERVTINVKMVADPARKEARASEAAIRRYEMKRIIHVNRRDPLSRMIGDLADRLQCDPADIIIEYKGTQVYRNNTPFHMGIQAHAEVDMLGYEKAVYEKISKQRELERRRRLAELNGDEYTDNGRHSKQNGDDSSEPDRSPPEDDPAGRAPKPETRMLKLQGEWGEAKVNVNLGITAEALLRHFCGKVKRPGEEGKLKLVWEGEGIEPTTTVGEMEVESGDVIDVVVK